MLIVDDHPQFTAAAGDLLRAEGMRVVGRAATGEEAVAAAARLRPDVVLLDVRLPDSDGFAVARRLAALEHPPAVVLTSSEERAALEPLVACCPARGFLPKEGLSGAALRGLLG